MRKSLFLSAAMMTLVAGGAIGPSFAQSSIGSTQTPASPMSGSQMPQPANSAPAGASTSSQVAPGSATGTAVMPGAKVAGSAAPMRPHRSRASQSYSKRDTMPAAVASDDAMAPPTSAYRGGAGSPSSTRASNISAGAGRSDMAPRLPDPNAANNSPEAYLAAAQRSLTQGKTGAAQEALERAETRILSRTTDPSMAAQHDGSMMAQNIAQARRALGNRDVRGAQAAISMALSAPVPPPGPSTTTVPGMGYAPPGMPSGRTY